jgi:hypothetical protein
VPLPCLWALAASLLTFALVRTTGAQSQASAGGGPAPMQAQPAQTGSLEVRLHPQEGKLEPPAELVLTDPLGRRTGLDPHGVEVSQAIPDSSYERESLTDDQTGAPGPVTLVLYVAHPATGEYRLQVIAHTSGHYSLEIRALDRELKPERAAFKDVPLAAGGVHTYRVRYAGEPRVSLEIAAPRGIQRSTER